MEQNLRKYTKMDYFIVNDLTKVVPKTENKYNRNIYQCNIDKTNKCDFIITSQGISEFQRLFKHLLKNHSQLLSNTLLKYLFDFPTTQNQLSSFSIVNDYIKENIFPIYMVEKQKSESINININNNDNSKHLLDITKIDVTKLNQTVLEIGIYEH